MENTESDNKKDSKDQLITESVEQRKQMLKSSLEESQTIENKQNKHSKLLSLVKKAIKNDKYILNADEEFLSDDENPSGNKDDSSRTESSLIDLSKSALTPALEQRLKKYVRYARHKAKYYSDATFHNILLHIIFSFFINFPLAITASGSLWQLIINGTRDTFTWITFLLTTWIIFWKCLEECLDSKIKSTEYHRDSIRYREFARNVQYEMSIGVDDRLSKCQIYVHQCKAELNEIDSNSRPLKMPLLQKTVV